MLRVILLHHEEAATCYLTSFYVGDLPIDPMVFTAVRSTNLRWIGHAMRRCIGARILVFVIEWQMFERPSFGSIVHTIIHMHTLSKDVP